MARSASHGLPLHMEALCSSAQELACPTHRPSYRLKKKEKNGKKSIQDKSTCPLAAQRASADVTSFWKRLLLDSGMSKAAASIMSCFFSLKSGEGPSHFAPGERMWD